MQSWGLCKCVTQQRACVWWNVWDRTTDWVNHTNSWSVLKNPSDTDLPGFVQANSQPETLQPARLCSRGHTQTHTHTTQSSSILLTSTVTSTLTTVLEKSKAVSSYGCYARWNIFNSSCHVVSRHFIVIDFYSFFNLLLIVLERKKRADSLSNIFLFVQI